MKKYWSEIKYWSQILLLPIYGLSFLFPRNKRIWVIGSTFGKRFADNPKYFYLYLNSLENQEVRPIWITKDYAIERRLRKKGFEVYYYKSFKGIWYTLRAGVYIFDNYSKDISFWCSARAKKINLWHGIPLKKIQMDNRFDVVRNPENRWKKIYWSLRRFSDEKPSHYVLATSGKLVSVFSSAFATDNVLVANYSRNDCLLINRYIVINTEEEQKIVDSITSQKYKKVILYMPTFRDSEKKFFSVIDIKRLSAFLEKEKILLLVKVHPKSKLKGEFEQISCNSICNICADADPYTFLGKVDALITDYSSIYFDFLLTDKPIIFFDYDREEYLSQSRELYQDYESYTPGRKVEAMEELFQALGEIEEDCSKWKENRARIRNEVFENSEQYGSEKLYSLIKNILNLK